MYNGLEVLVLKADQLAAAVGRGVGKEDLQENKLFYHAWAQAVRCESISPFLFPLQTFTKHLP